MGLDLKVLASHFRERRGEFLATAAIRFDRDEGLFSQLVAEAIPSLTRPLPVGVKVGHHEDAGLEWAEVDRHGQPLTYTTPADLRRLRMPEDLAPWNRAVLAFLLELPDDARIVLYWC